MQYANVSFDQLRAFYILPWEYLQLLIHNILADMVVGNMYMQHQRL